MHGRLPLFLCAYISYRGERRNSIRNGSKDWIYKAHWPCVTGARRRSRESGIMWVTLLLFLLLYNKRNPPVNDNSLTERVTLKNNYATFRQSGKLTADFLSSEMLSRAITYTRNESLIK